MNSSKHWVQVSSTYSASHASFSQSCSFFSFMSPSPTCVLITCLFFAVFLLMLSSLRVPFLVAVFSLDGIVLYVSFCLLFLHVIFLRLIVCIMYTYRICIVHTRGVYLFVHFLNCVAFRHWSIQGADVWPHFQLWRLWLALLHLSRLLLYFSSAVTLE